MFLDKYADVFVAAGLGVLVCDNRNFGDSDGQPRQEVDPYAQIRDYRDAITYARSLHGFERIDHRAGPDRNAGRAQRAGEIEDVLGEAAAFCHSAARSSARRPSTSSFALEPSMRAISS